MLHLLRGTCLGHITERIERGKSPATVENRTHNLSVFRLVGWRSNLCATTAAPLLWFSNFWLSDIFRGAIFISKRSRRKIKFVEMKFISKEKNKMASIRFQLILLLIELEAKKILDNQLSSGFSILKWFLNALLWQPQGPESLKALENHGSLIL